MNNRTPCIPLRHGLSLWLMKAPYLASGALKGFMLIQKFITFNKKIMGNREYLFYLTIPAGKQSLAV